MNTTRRGLVALLLVPGLSHAQTPAQNAPRRGPNGGPVAVIDGHPAIPWWQAA